MGRPPMVEKKLMDKHDAEYLIDQFNKYASWSEVQLFQIMFSTSAVIASFLAVTTVLAGWHTTSPMFHRVMWWVGFAFFGLMGFWFLRKSDMNRERLIALMNHVSRGGEPKP